MLPLLLLGLLLALPLPWHNQTPVDSTWIDVQLQAPTSRQEKTQQPEPQLESEPEPEAIEETKPEPETKSNPEPLPQEKTQAVSPQPSKLPPPDKQPVTPSTQPAPTTKQPTATDVMRMMSQPPRVELSDESVSYTHLTLPTIYSV